MTFVYLIIFIVSFFVLGGASRHLITSLTKIAKFLGWKEFVVAFFTMALASSIPNLSVGISSALHGVPQLSFSEIIGGNIIVLTLAVALAVLVSKDGLNLPSRLVQGSGIFTLIVAVLPLVLISDGVLSRTDGLVLILNFIIYLSWLFHRKDRFTKVYDHTRRRMTFKRFIKNLSYILLALFFLLLAAEGIVRSATYFSYLLNFPLILIGLFVVGLGNALPEIFFAIQAAKREEDWMVVGNLMGSVIFPATLVLGIVAIVEPIKIVNFSTFVVARFFLVIAALFFLLFLRTGRRVTKKEALFLLILYILFILTIIFH